MSELGSFLGNLGRDVEDMKQSLVPAGDVPAIFSFSSEKVNIKQVDTIIKLTFLSDSNTYICGHSTNSIVGTANGMGGGQLVVGSSGAGTQTTLFQRRYIWPTKADLNNGTYTENINIEGDELKLY